MTSDFWSATVQAKKKYNGTVSLALPWHCLQRWQPPWLSSNPSWSSRSSKRPRSSTHTSQTNMSKLSGTGRNPEALTTGCAGNSRARSWCPTLVMGATRKQSSCCPVASRSSWPTTSRSLKGCWCETNLTVLRLLQELKATVERAAPLAIRVANPNARLHNKENE